jgi:hypothetical protein
MHMHNPFATAEAWTPPSSHSGTKITRATQSTGAPWTAEAAVHELARRGHRVIRRGSYWMVQCPVAGHDDNDPSCQIRAGETVPLIVKCHAGCSQADVLEALGPPPGWQSQPLALQLPDDLDDCICRWHTCCLEQSLKKAGETLTSDEETGLLRWVHREQRQRLVRVGPISETSSSSTKQGICARGASLIERERRMMGLGDEASPGEAWLELPARLGRVMKLVVSDLVATVNGRLAAGDTRAVPYASGTVGQRVGVDPAGVRHGLARLRALGVVEKVDELPRLDGKRFGGVPLYALRVTAPCPFCAGDSEAGPGVTGLDSEDAAPARDWEAVLEPAVEQPEFAPMTVAELEEVADSWLAASVGSADDLRIGHGGEPYAEARLPFDPTVPIPF